MAKIDVSKIEGYAEMSTEDIPSVAAEVATGTGFYYSKAKVENRIKLMRQNKVTPNETHFSENY